MKAIIAIAAALISANALSQTPEEIRKAAPVSILGYTIGQKLDACPEHSKTTRNDYRRLCSLGPTNLAGAGAIEHSITLFNGEIIASLVRFGTREQAAIARVLADLREHFGDPDGSFSKPDLGSYVWVRGSVVMSFDGIAGLLQATDVIKTEVAKLRASPSNQFDF
jgi:hypothetical protein